MISIVTVAKRVLGGTKCLHHVISLRYSQINNKKKTQTISLEVSFRFHNSEK